MTISNDTPRTPLDLLAAESADIKAFGLKFSADWWTLHGLNLVLWMKHVHARYAQRPNTHFLEIGSLEGRSAIWLLRNILTGPGSTLTCVDLFDAEYESVFDANVAKAGVADRLTKLRGPSQRTLPTLPQYAFDIAYVDGAHEEEAVRLDAQFTWPLVKVGGIIVFDDYRLAVSGDGGPKPAIDAFLQTYENRIEVLDVGWQVFVQKVAP